MAKEHNRSNREAKKPKAKKPAPPPAGSNNRSLLSRDTTAPKSGGRDSGKSGGV